MEVPQKVGTRMESEIMVLLNTLYSSKNFVVLKSIFTSPTLFNLLLFIINFL
jgi:hypothetical protein